jgi:hypothetical protein
MTVVLLHLCTLKTRGKQFQTLVTWGWNSFIVTENKFDQKKEYPNRKKIICLFRKAYEVLLNLDI